MNLMCLGCESSNVVIGRAGKGAALWYTVPRGSTWQSLFCCRRRPVVDPVDPAEDVLLLLADEKMPFPRFAQLQGDSRELEWWQNGVFL